MILVDTHCHLYLPEFAPDLNEVIQRADNEGVTKFYLPAIDSKFTVGLLGLEQAYPGKCIAMTGLHPCSVKENYKTELRLVEESLCERRFAAVGEIGLDFYWDRTFEKEQYEAFHTQVELAKTNGIAIVIHSRDSIQESIELVRQHQDGRLKGIFHCFGESLDFAKQIIDLGFYLGIGGILTYKKSNLPETIKLVPLEHLVLETDSPYLTPVPFRGKRNESSYLKFVAAKLAEVKSLDLEEVATITTENSVKIFGC
jgi:TatD DNase family protein